MDKFLKKVISVFKILLPYILDNWKVIVTLISGLTISGILTGLGIFFNCLSSFTSLTVQSDIPLWILIAILPLLIYAVFIIARDIIKHFTKPPYYKFTSMSYSNPKNDFNWKLEWEWVLYKKKYIINEFHVICRKCGCELEDTKDTQFRGLYCPSCNNEWCELFDDENAARKVIEYRIKNKDY